MKTMLPALFLAFSPTILHAAAEPPSFAKQVRPFFARYCLECHNAKKAKAELDLETYASLLEGSEHGSVLVPGKPNDSKIVLLTEHSRTPHMPPKEARQPKKEHVAL